MAILVFVAAGRLLSIVISCSSCCSGFLRCLRGLDRLCRCLPCTARLVVPKLPTPLVAKSPPCKPPPLSLGSRDLRRMAAAESLAFVAFVSWTALDRRCLGVLARGRRLLILSPVAVNSLAVALVEGDHRAVGLPPSRPNFGRLLRCRMLAAVIFVLRSPCWSRLGCSGTAGRVSSMLPLMIFVFLLSSS